MGSEEGWNLALLTETSDRQACQREREVVALENREASKIVGDVRKSLEGVGNKNSIFASTGLRLSLDTQEINRRWKQGRTKLGKGALDLWGIKTNTWKQKWRRMFRYVKWGAAKREIKGKMLNREPVKMIGATHFRTGGKLVASEGNERCENRKWGGFKKEKSFMKGVRNAPNTQTEKG